MYVFVIRSFDYPRPINLVHNLFCFFHNFPFFISELDNF